ncbi:chromate efflux transporter [Leeia sp. TBRC 13508]|uniref:Chromate efflux transporter n=1 Tax=Leeia speluncae TaxID=2884804 RepID=A0ABS8D3H0_9NEIS|nr:chromate efflux transporter [Leeia speluncae]MCB6182724.1 chromate efflux transporter [Leeia speluncae]
MSNEASSQTNHTATPPAQMEISFWQAFCFWLKLGFISFGGPAGQIAIMHDELVTRRRWISEARFLHALNFCMVLPGPEAQQLATYLGWLMHRTWGGIVAGVLFIFPSLLLLIGLSILYVSYGQLPVIASVLLAIKPAVVAIVLLAVYRIAKRSLKHPVMWVVAALALCLIAFLHVPFPMIVAGAALIGWLLMKWRPDWVIATGHHAKTLSPDLPCVIDHQVHLAHTQFAWRRLGWVITVGLLLWLVPLLLIAGMGGWHHPLTSMGWFFTKAALLTFGGAYAVLPYVFQGAVNQFAWLSSSQMMDGLALGETTPGPLIMVVTFVGFLGGFHTQFLGEPTAIWAGIIAAVVVTWFTFLPSFIFIFAGGPLIEASRQSSFFAGPLAVITAAVVGVMLNLAIFFAEHVLWPVNGFATLDWWAIFVFAASMVALLSNRCSIIQLVLACCVVGVIRAFLF